MTTCEFGRDGKSEILVEQFRIDDHQFIGSFAVGHASHGILYVCIKRFFQFPSPLGRGKSQRNQGEKVLARRKPTLSFPLAGTFPVRLAERTCDA